MFQPPLPKSRQRSRWLPTRNHRLAIPYTRQAAMFRLCAHQDERGLWEVLLMDWPTIKRSEVSRKAEQQLRDRLGELP